ncbi:BolA/IbaG family iron-sulfur metabolism protein [Spirulina sp. CCNP1310]|uniref:BolA family protein n=1 Tax=Spirulina sp. CCNP1310 TaxID=3110249 RepID=UPI002B1F2B10|nr:BolA/IbaG family iron-sulfur metabolism protein [Spirulina sp. CCNP1310]MEA5417820.1 BolA/IbaG family iron-sulfur metabolism protein [Spirulina sp. CCNP1310]
MNTASKYSEIFTQYTQMIQSHLPDAQVFINDVTGKGNHLKALVISAEFVGQNKVKQHKMVYGALEEHLLSKVIHSLALNTYTPEGWEKDPLSKAIATSAIFTNYAQSDE